MAPARTYFVRLLVSEDYVPLVRDPKQAYRLSPSGVLDPYLYGTPLSDSEALSGALIMGDRQATVGDLRAGRARDIYWAIEDQENETAQWRTRTDVYWPGGRPDKADPGTYTFKYVVHAETYGGVTRVLDRIPMVSAHARRFREVLNGLSSEQTKNKRTKEERPKIDLVRTDVPCDLQAAAQAAMVTTSMMVPVSAALYVLLDPRASPDLIFRSTQQSEYSVPLSTLRWASYTSIKERLLALEQASDEESSNLS